MCGPMVEPLRSVPDVCDVTFVRGARAKAAAPDLLLEVPHGATRTEHFDRLRGALRGDYPADLQDFFHVNTDVGAPEVALRAAEQVVAAMPERSAVVLRSSIPRTFVDCNRRIDVEAALAGAAGAAHQRGEPTPGLHSYVREPHDRELCLRRYAAYRELATAAFAAVCGRGGLGVMVHSYAPRSIDVPIDADIVRHLRAAYAPDKIGSWPLRAPVDLIVHDPDGAMLASPALFAAVQAAYAQAGVDVVVDGAYNLHPVTLAHEFAVRHAQRTLCLELRRDLLVPEFTPFQEMHVDPAKVDRMAAPLAAAIRQTLA